MTVNITGVTPGVEVDGTGSVVNVTVTTGGGGGGVTVHNLLTGRDAEDAHPIGAITGLQDALDSGGASALADLTDVDVVSDPPAQDDVLAWDDTGGKWTPATLSGGADLSDTTPQALGTAAAGDGTAAARDDHVHAMPTAADVGADPAGTAAGLVDDLSGVSNQSAARTALGLGTAATADTGTGSANVILGNDARLTDARTPNVGGSNDDFMQRKSGAWTNRTIAQVKTDLGVFGANRWPLAANDHIDLSERHGAGYASTALSSNAANSNNTVIYVPFLIGKTISVDQLSIVCAGGNDGASAVVRLGIYAESSGRPGSVVVDAGTASINATGAKSLGFTAVQLAPGWYFAAIAVQGLNTSGSNPTFSSVLSSVKQMSPMPTIASSNDIGGYMSTSFISGAFAANPTVSHNRASSGLPAFRINMRVSTP